MQLPPESASYAQRVRYGRYLARRLRQKKETALATAVLDASLGLRTLGRAWEDADDPVQDALADRDGADDDLDEAAQGARATLAGRSKNAAKQEPYTLIVPDGFKYYTAAPAGDEATRYGLLKQRVLDHLPAADAVRKSLPKAIDAGLKAHATALTSLTAAQRAETAQQGKLTAATSKWAKLVEKTYGTLVTKYGRDGADAFFPRQRPSRAAKPGGDTGGDPPPNGGGDATATAAKRAKK